MQDLTVSIIQTALHWENQSANLEMFGNKIAAISEKTDLVVLPEMFSTGFSMNPSALADTMDGETVAWMKQMAEQKDAVITGSIIINETGKYYNRLVWMQPNGSYQTYDKRHLFRLANEQDVYTGGSERLIMECSGWKICPQVCYDLRFPVWNRNQNDYDLLLFVANWPERRNTAWKTLLRARAIENLAYVIGVNRVGKDGKDIYHSGDSSIINYKGDILYHLADEEAVFTLTLSKEDQEQFRNSFQFYKDADEFSIQ